MRIKEGFILKTIAGSTVAVPSGESLVNLQVMLTLNESGTFLWHFLEQETTVDALVTEMTKEYDIDAETAKEDVCAFISILKEHGILDEA